MWTDLGLRWIWHRLHGMQGMIDLGSPAHGGVGRVGGVIDADIWRLHGS